MACVDGGKRDGDGQAKPASVDRLAFGLPNVGQAWSPRRWPLDDDALRGLADVAPCLLDPKGSQDGVGNFFNVTHAVDAVKNACTVVMLSHGAGLRVVGLQPSANRCF